jgi:soluble lytic murein transglycosylase
LALSRAGAIGLLQVMPSTLDRVTAEWGLQPLSVEALYEPRVNIALGAQFFAERLLEFEDRLLPTLASYNAGERKAWEWLERAGGDADEVFVECIGYPETYEYTRRIPWLMWVYRSYYADAGSPPGLEAR